MNFVRYCSFAVQVLKIKVVLYSLLFSLLVIGVTGCSQQVSLLSSQQLAEFENAGPVRPTVDMDRLARARIGGGAYRVVPGDVLELTMPAILQVVTAEVPGTTEEFTPYVCRVSESGVITLPVVGKIEAAGKTLAQIESAVIDAYYPKYTPTRPSVFARVLEYKNAKVSITGAVEDPGVYELRNDQMSLVALLMKAGGIVDEGAALIQISRPYGVNTNSNVKLNSSDSKQNPTSDDALEKELLETLEAVRSLKGQKTAELDRRKKPEPIVLPVRGFNIPFADVALQDGDTVVVERLELPLFTVMGLVNKPGNFPYPPDVRYNLMQTLGFAGGLDRTAEPRYASIYRLKPDGGIVNVTFKIIENSKLTNASNTLIKPGDIVAVEHTPRTRTKLFLDRVFRINFGVYAPLDIFGQRD